ncbi:MAG: iron chelate uptake ABC transporter family permease subunit, partial [Mesorhizobium sp.]
MSDTARFRLVLGLLGALTLALFFLSLTVGPAAVAFGDSLRALFSDKADTMALIMQEIRLPRAILGLMIGATLGLSGAALQGWLRNPLAEPALLGVSASASLGAVIAIYTGFSSLFPLGLPLAALAGAVAAVLVVQ